MAEPAYRESASIPRIDPSWDLPTEAELPFDDGQPLPDGDFQRDPVSYALYGLREHYAGRTDVAVQGDMFLHYLEVDDSGEVVLDDEGRPVRRMLAPDVYVIFGVPNRKRNSYVTWDEGKFPDFVLEVLSFSTWRHDISAKKALYQRLGVPEFLARRPLERFRRAPCARLPACQRRLHAHRAVARKPRGSERRAWFGVARRGWTAAHPRPPSGSRHPRHPWCRRGATTSRSRSARGGTPRNGRRATARGARSAPTPLISRPAAPGRAAPGYPGRRKSSVKRSVLPVTLRRPTS